MCLGVHRQTFFSSCVLACCWTLTAVIRGRDCGTIRLQVPTHITPPLRFEPGWMTAAFLLLTP